MIDGTTYMYKVFRSTASIALYLGKGRVWLGSSGSSCSLGSMSSFRAGIVAVCFDAGFLML